LGPLHLSQKLWRKMSGIKRIGKQNLKKREKEKGKWLRGGEFQLLIN